jgi:response regulator NasT
VADSDPAMRQSFQHSLGKLGHDVCVVASGRQMLELCRASPPDLLIVEMDLPDRDGVSAVQEVCAERPLPVILVSARDDAGLVERAQLACPLACLVKPIKEAELTAATTLAVRNFERAQALAREVADLRRSLEDRKVLERAEVVAARRLGLDLYETAARLRRLASDQNRKLAEVARMVLAAEEVFGAMEKDLGRGLPHHLPEAWGARRVPTRRHGPPVSARHGLHAARGPTTSA